MDKIADPTNTRIICLFVDILDPDQIRDAIFSQINRLQTEIGFKFDGRFECSIVTGGDGSDYQQRKGIAYVFCTDKHLVWAFNGLTLDGKPLCRQEIRKVPIDNANMIIPAAAMDNSNYKVSSPPSICASDNDLRLRVTVSKSSSWADVVDDDDENIFDKPPVFADSVDSNVVKTNDDNIAKTNVGVVKTKTVIKHVTAATKPTIMFEEIVNNIEDKPLIVPFEWQLNEKQKQHYKNNCNQDKNVVTIEPTARLIIDLDFDNTYSAFTLATSMVDDNITEKHIKSHLTKFVSDEKKIVNVRIGNKTYHNSTYPIVYTRYSGKSEKRVILARFDPTTKDAEYALYICRQTIFNIKGKEAKAVFVNAWQSMC